MEKRLNVELELNEACPCKSGLLLKDCCFKHGRMWTNVGSLVPPGPKTHYSHPKCYLNGTANCSSKISAEHYISKSVLAALGEEFEVFFPSLPLGESRKLRSEHLAANILCERHNSALSPLDSHAERFVKDVDLASQHVTKKSLSRKRLVSFFSGDALELWALKVLFGLYYAGLALSDYKPIRDTHSIDVAVFIAALERGYLNHPLGLYMRPTVDQSARIAFVSLSMPGDRTAGIRSRIGPLEADWLCEYPGEAPTNCYRPCLIHFEGLHRDASLFLTWASGKENAPFIIKLKRFNTSFRDGKITVKFDGVDPK